MHVCLFKGVIYYSEGMELEVTKDGERNLVQLWSVDMTSEARDASFMRFDRYIASRLKLLLRGDCPRIPQSLLELVRPKDHPKGPFG